MKRKYNRTELNNVPNDKPITYKIQTESGKTNYVGTAMRGQANSRVADHLGEIPGAIVEITQHESIQRAREVEKKAIERLQPKYNTQHKKKS